MKIIVDQSIGESSAIYAKFLKWLGHRTAEFLFIAKTYPGIPDVEILDKLLNKETILLTSDCILHNRAIEKKFKSYTQNRSGQLTNKKLSYVVSPKKMTQSVRKELCESYEVPCSMQVREITSMLGIHFSEKQHQRFKTKRRRIRSYFGDIANMASADLTIGCEQSSKGYIGGYFLKINARQSLKALSMASEGYCCDTVARDNPLTSIFHALLHYYLLHLTHMPVTLYITSTKVFTITQDILQNSVCSDFLSLGIKILLENLSKVEIMPCAKGPFFEKMRNKLLQMQSGVSNELISIDSQLICQKLLSNASEPLE